VFQANLLDPAVLAYLPSFKDILAVPHSQRAALYRDPAWRDRARPEVTKAWDQRWAKISIQETKVHADLRDIPLAQLAAERRADPFDLMVDLALQEDLLTRFRVVLANDDEEDLAMLLRDHATILGGHDGGAHASQICDACYPTYLLGHWVRDRGVLSLEEAIWRLCGQPAEVFGIEDRGVLEPGTAADIMAFDPTTVAANRLERVYDLPAGADRLIATSIGMQHVWVNGVPIIKDGKDCDFEGEPERRPGKVVRGRA
jgi:N-acyl-D-aspartate/D-glutamate deacylase